MRDNAWRALGRWMTQNDWQSVLDTPSCEEKYNLQMSELTSAVNIFLPARTIKKHLTDRPWVTSKLKSWIRKQQAAIFYHGIGSFS